MPGRYKADKEEFLQLLSELKDMSDGQPGQVKRAKHRMKITSNCTLRFHSTLYRAGPTDRQLTAMEIKDMLQESFIEVASRN